MGYRDRPASAGATIPDPHPGPITAAAVGPGGVLAMGSEYGYGYLWDATTGQRLDVAGLYHDDEVDVTALAFAASGERLASAALDGSIHIIDIEAQGRAEVLAAKHAARVDALAFSPDGRRLASADRQGGLIVWRIGGDAIAGTPLSGHSSPAESLAFSADGRLLASGHSDGRIILWEMDPRPLRQEVFAEGETWLGLALSPAGTAGGAGGRMLAALRENGIVLWDMASREQIGELLLLSAPTETKSGELGIGTLSPDQPLEPGMGLLSPLETLALEERPPSLAFNADGSLLASVDRDGGITLWDVRTMTATAHLAAAGSVTDLAFGPAPPGGGAPSLAAALFGGGLSVWDTATLRARSGAFHRPQHCTDLPGAPRLAYKPDGLILAAVLPGSRDYGHAALWDAVGEEVRVEELITGCRPIAKSLPAQQPDARAVAFSPDGKLLAAGSLSREIKVWRMTAEGAGSPNSLPAGADVTAMAFGLDSRMLGDRDLRQRGDLLGRQQPADDRRAARRGRRPGGHVRLQRQPPPGGVRAARSSVALDRDGRIIVWQVDLATWQSLACRMAGGNLSRAEWDTYFPDGTVPPDMRDLPTTLASPRRSRAGAEMLCYSTG